MENKVSPTEEVSCMRFKEKNTEKKESVTRVRGSIQDSDA
jgi:hypothetical protein